MIKVSVIIPIYNADKYLAKCIDSVIGQTLTSIEIICIDDGSIDNSWQIIQEFAKKDSRITAIRQKNNGPATTRNKGIELAKGEFIGFIDSDDTIDEDYFEVLYKHAKATRADIVRGYVKNKFFTDKPSARMKNDASSTEDFYNHTNKRAVKQNKLYLRGVVWLAIYKKSLIHDNKITFPEGIYSGEDVLFNLVASYYAKKVNYANKKTYYHYLIHRDSIVNNYSYTGGGVLSKSLVVQENIKFLNSKYDYDKTAYIERVRVALQSVNKALQGTKSLDKEIRKKIIKLLVSSWKKVKYKQEIKTTLQDIDKDFVKALESSEKFSRYISQVLSIRQVQPSEEITNVYNTIKSHHGLSKKNLLKQFTKAITPYGVIIMYRKGKPKIIKKLSSYKAKLPQSNYQKKEFDNLCKHLRKIPKNNDPKIVVSLTTHGKRIEETAPLAVLSIFTQSVLPDKVVLWLGHGEKPSRGLKKLAKFGLEIKYTKDLKAYTKLLPALRTYPNSAIITVDDDIAYPNTWLENTLKTYKDNPNSIIVNRAREITVNNGILESYWRWPKTIKNPENYHAIFPTGVGGVLYPSGVFEGDLIFDESLFSSLSPGNDDIWFWAVTELGGVERVIVENGFSDTKGCELGSSTVDGLFKTTNSGNRNDAQFNNVLNYFPELKEKLGMDGD